MRVRMPEINTPERRKNSRVVEVKTQAEADALVAQGGAIMEDEPEPETTTKKGHK